MSAKYGLIFISLFTFFTGCSTSSDEKSESEYDDGTFVIEEEDLSKVNSNTLYIEVDSLRNDAFESETLKLDFSTRIVTDLEANGVVLNTDLKKDVLKSISEAKNSVYSNRTFNNEDSMLQYDSDIATLIASLEELSKSVDNFDNYEKPARLLDRIKDTSTRDLMLRGYYNQSAFKWNKLVRDYKSKVEKENPTLKVVEVKYFYGQEPII
ncbi:hypothetical protein [Flammeovirga kamogawensis]|uniref:DUF4349 domain-containing protein n=1 Tax=Flammeovirga kamogawensis TaxID=373891 RepID=A0ABX8GUN7_9BACT|nr:hypothetical protein [Flammeovirga kamogawensis]MBB6459815.1 hypothetical protein [Flammeovirga kamogawensis]QWG07129.1 hypothetical protein KM029_17785 [Flammeovirga kamogawensis]TRX68951.1 hypothetical protein EO216_12775 [Flammeovirga kamogawensis]